MITDAGQIGDSMRTRTLNVLAAIAHVALLTAVTFAQESETSARVRALNNAVVDLHAKLQTASSADRANLRLQAASILEERAVELATLIQHQPAEALSVAFTPELLEDLRTSFPELAPRFESRDT